MVKAVSLVWSSNLRKMSTSYGMTHSAKFVLEMVTIDSTISSQLPFLPHFRTASRLESNPWKAGHFFLTVRPAMAGGQHIRPSWTLPQYVRLWGVGEKPVPSPHPLNRSDMLVPLIMRNSLGSGKESIMWEMLLYHAIVTRALIIK